MDKKIIATTTVASIALAGSLIVGASTASASSCLPTQGTAQAGCDSDTVSSVTPSVGVDFRDADGNRTSSGLSRNDQFEWLGAKKQGKGGDGILIEIRQITQGRGGWGLLYTGWIPVKYTQLPALFE